MDNIIMYEVREEIHNEIEKTWSYHLYPVGGNGMWMWNKKVERLEVSLVSLGKEFGRFWEGDDIVSWSIISKWSRPK